MKPSYVKIGLWREGRVRIYAAETTQVVQTITHYHHTLQVASAALGRTLTVAAMMGTMLKDDAKLTIKITGNGPLGYVIVDATSTGQVRGFVQHPDVVLPLKSNGKIDVGGGIGQGTLSVTKSLSLKQNYATQVALQNGEIGEDFSFYFLKSEQSPSVVAVGVLVDTDYSIAHAGGWIIQLMPDATDEDFGVVENLANTMPQPTKLLAETELQTGLDTFMPDIQWLDRRSIVDFCTCSIPRFVSGIATLHSSEIEEMIHTGGVDIRCEFCGKHYHLGKEHLEDALSITKDTK